MRQGSQGSGGRRGRNRSGGGGGGGGGRKPNQPSRNHVYDSNGPDVKVRGNAFQVYEKYIALARDAVTASEHVRAEGLFQHGEHYLRIHNLQNPPQPKKVEEVPAEDPASSDQPAVSEAQAAANGEQPTVEIPVAPEEQPQPSIDVGQPQPSLLDAAPTGEEGGEKPAPAPKRRPRRKKPVEQVAVAEESKSDEPAVKGSADKETQPTAAE